MPISETDLRILQVFLVLAGLAYLVGHIGLRWYRNKTGLTVVEPPPYYEDEAEEDEAEEEEKAIERASLERIDPNTGLTNSQMRDVYRAYELGATLERRDGRCYIVLAGYGSETVSEEEAAYFYKWQLWSKYGMRNLTAAIAPQPQHATKAIPGGIEGEVTTEVASGVKADLKANTLKALEKLPRSVPMPQAEGERIPFLLDSNGKWQYLSLGRDGHWGIFGTSGSGKGNMLQFVALYALCYGPNEVELVVIDAKSGLDYGFCTQIKHARLYCDKELVDGCIYVVDEMRRRLNLLKAANCRNAIEYQEKTGQRLPWLVVIADEIADFLPEQRIFIETFARMSRAAGGVLFVATQYPTADVLSSQIQANVTNRLVFRLTSSQYVPVALRRLKGDSGTFDPSLITKDLPGAAVWRSDGGQEYLGRVANVTDAWRTQAIDAVAQNWPKDPPKSAGVPRGTLPTVSMVFELKKAGFIGERSGEQGRGTPGSGPGNGGGTATNPEEEEPTAGGLDDETIAAMLRGGLPKRKIMQLLKGKNEKRLEQIRRVEKLLAEGLENK